ncbi:MAG: sulfatase, partial [Planctomycetota bacterium]
MRILYLDLDALNPSHLSCYGYARPTSPTIDSIASQGVRFTNCYAADAPCLPSRTGLYSGRFGIQTGVVGHGGLGAQPKPETTREFRDSFGKFGLAAQLRNAGMHTAMISPFGERHSAHWFYAGFKEIHNTGKSGQERVDDVQPVVEKWLGEHASDDNWFLHVNYWDIHTPYRTPMEYGHPFQNTPLSDDYTADMLKRHQTRGGPHSPLDVGMYTDAGIGYQASNPRVPDRLDSMDKLKQWIDGYDTAIRYVDDAIAKIVAMLKEAGVYDETTIVISADHGENQGHLGIYGEHATADHATCNIPLIV